MKNIEFFFVGKDIQIQIDEKNPEWYDKYGKLLIEDVEVFLQDNDFVEDRFEVWRDTRDDTHYSFTNTDIQQLKNTGIGRMHYIG